MSDNPFLEPPKHVPNHMLPTNRDKVQEVILAETRKEMEEDGAWLQEEFLNPEATSPEERRRLPEEVFRRNFLPLMTGEAYSRLPPNMTPKQLHDEAQAIWLNIAGTHTAEVDVVDHNGDVCFTVPALVDSENLVITQHPTDRQFRHFANDLYERALSDSQGANFALRQDLKNKIGYMTSGKKDSDTEASAKIAKIREYYNLPSKKKEGEDSAPGDTQTGDQGTGSDFMGEMYFD